MKPWSLPSVSILSAMSSARARLSMPPTWPWNRSDTSLLCRRTLASKLKPPVVKPPAATMRATPSDSSAMSLPNWSAPAQLRITAVHVDAAEDPRREGIGDLVLEAVPRQRGVVRLDVHAEVLGRETVFLE